ncbi:MAG: enoyl-CoA hydratase, partial [Acidobacteria bacterium]|nr:enoyl-CoA hydratase [Acidobacteriota bacterium]
MLRPLSLEPALHLCFQGLPDARLRLFQVSPGGVVQAVAAQGPAFVAAGKKLFYRQIEDGLTGAYEKATKTMVKNMQREDAREGINAFLEKR